MSGGNVPALRSFVMIAVMLVAVLADRRALSMRSFALSAIIILLWQPETLLEAGFQMSFAATAALIWGFNALRERVHPKSLSRWVAPFFMLVVASLIGGLSTGPFAAAHFNRIAVYGLLGNLMAVPVMELLVMPAAAVAALLAPLGAAGPPLWVMEQGARWILWVAHWVAALPGAVRAVVSPGPGCCRSSRSARFGSCSGGGGRGWPASRGWPWPSCSGRPPSARLSSWRLTVRWWA